MSKKYNRKELFKLPAVEVYKMVLRGDLKRFPKGFWLQPEAKANAINCVKFLIEDILKWNEDDIKNNLCTETFADNKLQGMLHTIFESSPFVTINIVYPNKFKGYEFKTIPRDFWTIEKGIKEIKYLIEEKLRWSDEDIKNYLTKNTFVDNGLESMLKILFNSSPFLAIDAAYPNKFKKEDLKAYYSKIVVVGNDLESIYPNIAKEWHPTLNNDLKLRDVSKGSNKKVWWECKYCNEKYEKEVFKKVRLKKCPCCKTKYE